MMPLYNVKGVVLMSVKENTGDIRVGNILKSILKNPMVLSILAGLPFALFHIELPYIFTKSFGYLQSATSTMAPRI